MTQLRTLPVVVSAPSRSAGTALERPAASTASHAKGYPEASSYVRSAGSATPRAPAHGFEQAFTRVIGPEALKRLVASFTDAPVILVAGELCSGKGTTCEALALALGGAKDNARSTGQMIRGIAAARGLTAQQLRDESVKDPRIDVGVDYVQAQVIATGRMDVAGGDGKPQSVRVLTLDSRLAGLMGAWLRSLGRDNLFTVNLTCAPRERALRLVQRQFSAEVRARIDAALQVPGDADVTTCFEAIKKLGDPATQHAAGVFANEAARDQEDRERLRKHYGVDFFDKSMFDLTVDTTDKTPAQVVAAVLARVPAAMQQRG